ncbi:uncharacterized protein LOC117221780 [Megalopta genalis]|uniref:uncharacterized protein LOC117221780 n=1 Tax=Megalopta genalis TaxID=115081 RepID=UPI003FD1E817
MEVLECPISSFLFFLMRSDHTIFVVILNFSIPFITTFRLFSEKVTQYLLFDKYRSSERYARKQIEGTAIGQLALTGCAVILCFFEQFCFSSFENNKIALEEVASTFRLLEGRTRSHGLWFIMTRILALCIIEAVLPALAIRSDLLALESKSWISDEDFQIMVELSFPFSGCCNVFFSARGVSKLRRRLLIQEFSSAPLGDAVALFSQFRSVYPYEYLLRRSTYECDGYFLLGSSDDEILRLIEKIPSLTWKTEILVVVNNQTSDDSAILEDSVYETANVNVVSVSGIWKLAENYLKPRLFAKVDRYEEMGHNYEHFNFRGRQLRIATIHRPPMTIWKHPLKRIIDSREKDVYLTDRGFDGIEVQLFLIVAEKLNFTWTARKLEGNLIYGEVINGSWEGGIIGMLYKNQADIAIGSIMVTQTQNQYIQLSQPLCNMHVRLMVPRPRRVTSFWAILKPFSKEVWYLLILAIVLLSSYTCARAWIVPKFPKRFRNYLITVTELIGCLLSSSVPKTVGNNKLQILLWQTAGWLIITAYCSSLAARLATSEYESRIDTIEQFLATNLSWANMGQTPPFEDYIDPSDPYSMQLPSRYRHVDSFKEWTKLTVQTDLVVPGKMIGSCFFPENYVRNSALQNYRLMKTPIGRFYAAFGLQQWLLTPVNRIILSLKETGIVDWHLNDVTRRYDSQNLREVLVEHDGYEGDVQVLGLMPLAAGFLLLFLGSSAAVFVFYMELKQAAKSASIRHILRAVGDNRKREKTNLGELRRHSKLDDFERLHSRFQSIARRSAR